MVTRLFHEDFGNRQHTVVTQMTVFSGHIFVSFSGRHLAVFGQFVLLTCAYALSTIFVSLSQEWLVQHLHTKMSGTYREGYKTALQNSVLNKPLEVYKECVNSFLTVIFMVSLLCSVRNSLSFTSLKKVNLMCCVYLHSIPYRWIFCFNMRASFPQTETKINTPSSWKSKRLYELKWYTAYTNV